MQRGFRDALGRFEEAIAVVLLVLVFAVVGLQVVTRFAFQNPPFWTEELARYLFVWIVAVGAAEGVRSRTHIAMDLVPFLLPVRVRALLALVMNLLVLAALLVVVWYGWLGAVRAHRVMSVAIGVPESWLYGAAPVGAALMALRVMLGLRHDIAGLRRVDADSPAVPAERYL